MLASLIVALTILAGPAPGKAAAPPSLCSSSERIYFSCVTKPGHRLLSLCGSHSMTKTSGYLQYRFGRSGKVELEYPSKRDASTERFRYYHYSRYRIDRQGVVFDHGGYRYAVFHHYEGDTPPEQVIAGVDVSRGVDGPTVREIACTAPTIHDLSALENVLPCDEENALAMCPDG